MAEATVFEEIEVLDNYILFVFEEDRDAGNHNAFVEKSQGGIILKSSVMDAGKYARWGVVKAVGNGVDECIQPGTRILIEPLKWTKVSTYKGEEFARTENSFVLAIGE